MMGLVGTRMRAAATYAESLRDRAKITILPRANDVQVRVEYLGPGGGWVSRHVTWDELATSAVNPLRAAIDDAVKELTSPLI